MSILTNPRAAPDFYVGLWRWASFLNSVRPCPELSDNLFTATSYPCNFPWNFVLTRFHTAEVFFFLANLIKSLKLQRQPSGEKHNWIGGWYLPCTLTWTSLSELISFIKNVCCYYYVAELEQLHLRRNYIFGIGSIDTSNLTFTLSFFSGE